MVLLPRLTLWCAAAAAASGVPMPAGGRPELQFLLFLQDIGASYNVTAVKGLFRRAKTAGYSSFILYDHNLGAIEAASRLNPEYLPSLRKVLSLAKSMGLEPIPQVYSYGHADGIVFQDASMAEARPATAKFVVAGSGRALVSAPPGAQPSALPNGHFTGHEGGENPNKLTGWSTQDAIGTRTFYDSSVSHRPGQASLRTMASSAGTGATDKDARVGQFNITVTPHSTVRATCFVQASGFEAGKTDAGIQARIQWNFDGMNACDRVAVKTVNHPKWTQVSTVCNVGNATDMQLYLGIWGNDGPAEAAFWWSDCKVELLPGSGGINNLVRRDGAPLLLKDEDGKVYHEGQDYDPIANAAPIQAGFYPAFQPASQQPNVTLPPTTRLKPGQPVTIDYCEALSPCIHGQARPRQPLVSVRGSCMPSRC
eukprot:COSAG01_NODE_6973_length_3410_cov_2.729085_3_plen_425_part_00